MTELVKSQIYDCSIMLIAGVFLGMIRTLFCYAKNRLNFEVSKIVKKEKNREITKNIIEWIGEIIFFAVAAVMTFSYLYYCSYGIISFHAFISFGIGVLLWKYIFCDIINI